MKVKEMTQYQVAVAAEGIAAALFARAGFHVSVQYGANQPGYDLIVEKERTAYLVSVKGSQDGGWGLTQSYLKNADYHGAIEKWLIKQGAHLILCFVQFQNKLPEDMPDVYLARSREVAEHMNRSGGGLGDTVLWVRKEWKSGKRAGVKDAIPAAWRFSKKRVGDVLSGAE